MVFESFYLASYVKSNICTMYLCLSDRRMRISCIKASMDDLERLSLATVLMATSSLDYIYFVGNYYIDSTYLLWKCYLFSFGLVHCGVAAATQSGHHFEIFNAKWWMAHGIRYSGAQEAQRNTFYYLLLETNNNKQNKA